MAAQRAKVELWHEKVPAAGGAPAFDRFRRIIYLEGELIESNGRGYFRSPSIAQ